MNPHSFEYDKDDDDEEEGNDDEQQDDQDEWLRRKRPNILVTGTPGVGKTSTASRIAEELHMIHIQVGELIQQHKCYEGYDEELQTHILDEDALLDILEPLITSSLDNNNHDDDDMIYEEGGRVVDYHSCELFPQRFFDLILVLRADTNVLYDRLTLRGYNTRKREENMECEIMGILAEEARNSYDPDIVQELPSNTLQDLEDTIRRVQLWYQNWMENHSSSSGV